MEFGGFAGDTGRGWDIHGNGVTDLISRLKVGWRSACIVSSRALLADTVLLTHMDTCYNFIHVIVGVHLDEATSSKHWTEAAPDKGRGAYFEALLNIILDFSRE
jgi:hypothetical protein